MDTLIAFLGILSFVAFIVGVVGLIKGNVKRFKIHSRKMAAIVTAVAFVAIGIFTTVDNALQPPVYQLSITVEGEGFITPEPGDHTYEEGHTVELVATPAEGYQFAGWQGDYVALDSTIRITLNNDIALRAVFSPLASAKEPTDESTPEVPDTTDDEKPDETEPKDDDPPPPSLVDGTLEVHVIDVGQGLSAFIVGPDGTTMLYDAGGDGDVGNIIVNYIRSLGYNSIDIAVFTHPHADHINGAPTVFEKLDVKSVYYSGAVHTTLTFERFLDAIENAGLLLKRAVVGVTIPFGQVEAVIVAPAKSDYTNLNDYSTAIRMRYGDTSILLTGDNETESENEMLSGVYDLNVNVLLVSHHGSNSSTPQVFLNATSPQYAIISAGANNRYGHPHQEVLDRLTASGIEIFVTAVHGNIIASLDGKNVLFATSSGQTEPVKTEPPKQEQPQQDEPTPVAKLSATATMDDSTPAQYSNVTVTVVVKNEKGNPVSGADVSITAHYKNTTSDYSGTTNDEGIANITFGISRASIDFTVNVQVTASKDNLTATTSTSFTPRAR